jgi:hypothetical protein
MCLKVKNGKVYYYGKFFMDEKTTPYPDKKVTLYYDEKQIIIHEPWVCEEVAKNIGGDYLTKMYLPPNVHEVTYVYPYFRSLRTFDVFQICFDGRALLLWKEKTLLNVLTEDFYATVPVKSVDVHRAVQLIYDLLSDVGYSFAGILYTLKKSFNKGIQVREYYDEKIIPWADETGHGKIVFKKNFPEIHIGERVYSNPLMYYGRD